MKIRTDFVTNSSSASSACVMVDNLVLLEILQKYKEMGVFGDAIYEIDYTIGCRSDFIEIEDEGKTKTPAFHYSAIESVRRDHPKTLEEVVAIIITMLDSIAEYDLFDKEIFKQMEKELDQKKEEIMVSYTQVIWRGSNHGWGDFEPETGDECEWDFYYDPVKGENYEVEYYEREDNK